MKWSPEQQRAIDGRDSNILVSAAAGSGKTAVLTGRILDLMKSENLDIDRFLVFTFSRGAAKEMKERLYKSLVEGLRAEENKGFYQRQLLKINQARITTIHAFCNEVIKEHFYKVGMDPDYRIGEERDFHDIKDEVLDGIMEKAYAENDPDFITLVEIYGGNRGDRELRQIILETHQKLQALPYLEEWREKAAVQGRRDEFWLEAFVSYLKERFDQALRINEGGLRYIEAVGAGEVLRNFFEAEGRMIQSLGENLDPENLDFEVSFSRYPTVKDLEEEEKETLKHIREAYKKILMGLKKDYFGSNPYTKQRVEFDIQHERVMALIDLIFEFHEALIDYKKKENMLEFADLEHFSLDILKEEGIRSYYQERFDYVFVDEYQDSNLIQEEIINRISRGRNLFMVGDLKQSIYRFRLARPEIFRDKYKRYQALEDSANQKIDLNKNFRSGKNILSFINYIFHDFMAEDFGGIDYDEASRLYPGLEAQGPEEAPVEIDLIRIPEGPVAKEDIEVFEIASRVRALHQEGIPYSDMVVLMRSPASYVESFNRIFTRFEIPVFFESTTEFMESLEVALILNMLKVLDNPRQDIPLASLLRSPLYGFDDEDLYQVRRQNPGQEYFHDCLLEGEFEEALGRKVAAFKEDIRYLREISRFVPMDELVWEIFTTYHFQEFFMGLTGGDQRIGNVRKLMDLGSHYQEQGSASLGDFNRYMTVLKEKQLKIQSARVVGEDSELVRLMSVHKSKGLEFPVVIYAGLGKRFNRQEFNDALLFHNEWGVVSRYYDLDYKGKKATFHRDVLVNRLKAETAEEELRILYVALTRARERLVILGGVRAGQLDKKTRFWQSGIHLKGIRDQDTPLDWLMYNLYLDKNIEPPQKRVRIIERDRQEYEGLLGKKSHDSLEAFEGYLRDEVMREDEDLVLPEESVVRSEAIQAKMAVTALAHETLDPGEGVAMSYPDDFLRLKNTRTPQEIGIEIHRLVEFVDDKKIRTLSDFMTQVRTLQKRKILSEDLESEYDLDQVYGFFTSPLGRRLARADRVYRERPFVLRDESLQGALVQGVIDLFFVEEGEVVLVDFKSDFVTETDYGRYLEAYQKQLSYYQRAIETLTGLKVKESYIHFFKINRSLLMGPSS